MGRERIKKVGEFTAVDAKGRTYRILVFQHYADASDLSGEDWIPTLQHLETADRQKVNRIEKGRYEIVAYGIELTSDDPNAL